MSVNTSKMYIKYGGSLLENGCRHFMFWVKGLVAVIKLSAMLLLFARLFIIAVL